MKLIIKGMLIGSLLITGATAKENNVSKEVKKELIKTLTSTNDILILTTDNSDGKITTKTILSGLTE